MTTTHKPPLWRLTPTGLVKALLGLRGLALAIFPLAIGLAVILQRGFWLIVLLAAAMVAVGELDRRRALRLAGDKQPRRLHPASLIQGFAIRFAVLAGLFIVLTGFFALFRNTSLVHQLGWVDLAILVGSAGLALGANEMSTRLAVDQAEATFTAIRAALPSGRGSGMDAGGDIIDGEIIDPAADEDARPNGTGIVS